MKAREFIKEDNSRFMADVIQARSLIGNATQHPGQKQQYFDYIKDLSDKYGHLYSTDVHQEASKLSKKSGIKEEINKPDCITVDVPLLIRLLEYAREDAKTDMDLHVITENLIELSENGKTLTMQDYSKIVGKQ